MKKIVITISIVFALFSVICAITILSRYYAPPNYMPPYKLCNDIDTLRIAYIGDSWAFMHKRHQCKITHILKEITHQPIEVHSFGVCGLTSKEIYENLHLNNNFINFLQAKGFNYCFISAGINDCNKKMGIKIKKRI